MLREQAEDALRWTAAVLGLPGALDEPAAPAVRALRMALSVAVPGSGAGAEGGGGGAALDGAGVRHGMEAFKSAADGLAGQDDSYPPVRVLRPMLLFFAERREESLRLIEERLADDPDPWVRAAARSLRMAFAENEGDLDRMRADVEAGVREWTDLGDIWGLAAVLGVRGQLRVLDGDLEGAAVDFEEAQRRLQVLGTASDDLMAHMRLADLRLRVGDTAGARAHVAAMLRSRSPGELETMRDVMAEATEASIALAEQDGDAVRGTRERLLAALRTTGAPSPFQAHATAVGLCRPRRPRPFRRGRRGGRRAHPSGYQQGVTTNDLPILATVGVAAAAVALADGRPARPPSCSAPPRGCGGRRTRRARSCAGWRTRAAPPPASRPGTRPIAGARAMDRSEATARLDPDRPERVGGAEPAVVAGQARRR